MHFFLRKHTYFHLTSCNQRSKPPSLINPSRFGSAGEVTLYTVQGHCMVVSMDLYLQVHGCIHTPSTGFTTSFLARCRKAMLGVWVSCIMCTGTERGFIGDGRCTFHVATCNNRATATSVYGYSKTRYTKAKLSH